MADMNAGALDRRILIERLAEGAVNGFGEPAGVWATLISVAAARQDVSDVEKVAAGQRAAALMCRFVIRSSIVARTVSALDRLTHDGLAFNILGIKETSQGRGRFLEITAVARSD